MRRGLWLTLLCLLASALSYAYVAFYLRGGPRIIDATSYWLEARSLAAGAFTFEVPEPSASFRGRFLLPGVADRTFGVIFPPGYPLVLALGMWLGAPLLVGPALAGSLVAATYALARAAGQDSKVAWIAALLSATCAALRYHTADTMSHGLSALLACAALTCALRRDLRAAPLLAGGCLGLLLATRPVSAGVSLLLVGLVLRAAGPRAWLQMLLGTLPGVALLLLQQRALTGNVLGSTQLAYYALADAPPGCFRYGFGAGIGCRFEHGDFVERFLPHGYGLLQAARNLFVHLGLFSVDATNAVPLTLLGAYAAIRHWRSKLGLLGAGIALQALAYVPFYFDGNYPGGGARFLCEAIPFCQVLVARAAFDLRLERLAVPVAVLGFVLHARRGHELLREREGGRPMFESAVVARAGVQRGLLFVETDHGFNLGHDPAQTDPRAGVVVARLRNDGHDRALYERLGRPPSYRYAYDVTGRAGPTVTPFTPQPSDRFEGEAQWPARLASGSAYPIHFPCASGGRALRLFPGTRALIELPVDPSARHEELVVGWVSSRAEHTELLLTGPDARQTRLSADQPGCTSWRVAGQSDGPLLSSSERQSSVAVTVELLRGEGAVDFVAWSSAVTR